MSALWPRRRSPAEIGQAGVSTTTPRATGLISPP